jgi:hypothetical protein
MTSISTEYYQILLAQGICASVGAFTIFCTFNPKDTGSKHSGSRGLLARVQTPAMSTVTTWFFRKRGMALGIIASGSSLGGVILPIMVRFV